jgi:hypothetical protein
MNFKDNPKTLVTKSEIEDMQEKFEVLTVDLTKLSGEVIKLNKEIFNRDFMDKYTLCETFDEFIEKVPCEIESKEFESLEELNNFVSQKTVFDNWAQMKKKAIEEWIASKFGF